MSNFNTFLFEYDGTNNITATYVLDNVSDINSTKTISSGEYL